MNIDTSQLNTGQGRRTSTSFVIRLQGCYYWANKVGDTIRLLTFISGDADHTEPPRINFEVIDEN